MDFGVHGFWCSAIYEAWLWLVDPSFPSIYLCAILSTIISKVFSFSLCSHCWISHIHLCTSLWCHTLSSCSWPAMHCTLSEQSRKTLNISSYDNQCVSCSSACFNLFIYSFCLIDLNVHISEYCAAIYCCKNVMRFKMIFWNVCTVPCIKAQYVSIFCSKAVNLLNLHYSCFLRPPCLCVCGNWFVII